MYIINKQQIKKKANIKQNRFLEIAKLGETIFHIDDFARMWGIEKRATLNITLKRYADLGLLYRLYRGLYSLNKPTQIDPLLLGSKAINNYCYLTGETVLIQHGIILQKIDYFTFVSEQTKRFNVSESRYYCRQLKDYYLYNDIGVDKSGKINVASLERAVADILYFNPNYYFDNLAAIDWAKVKNIQKIVYNKINL